jgi:RHS repeat-associated protein
LRIARGDSGAVEVGVSSALDLYPYGTPFVASVAESKRHFTGHERDTSTGMDYMLARYHGANLGRFLSTDPGDDTYLDAPQSLNKYSYVRNSPVVHTDPDGRYARGAGFTDCQWKRFDAAQKNAAKRIRKVADKLNKAAEALKKGGVPDRATRKTVKQFEKATGEGNGTAANLLAAASGLTQAADALQAGTGSQYVATGLNMAQSVAEGRDSGVAASAAVGGTTIRVVVDHFAQSNPMLAEHTAAHEALHNAGYPDQLVPGGEGKAYKYGKDRGALRKLRDVSPSLALVNPDNLLQMVFP